MAIKYNILNKNGLRQVDPVEYSLHSNKYLYDADLEYVRTLLLRLYQTLKRLDLAEDE